jgi:C4-dicarboxylate-specific signal transduction histidine kinase
MFLAFGLFIVACELTHFIEVVTVGDPVYILSAAVKGFTAAASVTTAIVLPFMVQQILLTVRKARESERYTRFLESAVSERDTAQNELRRLNEILEARIQQRTADLARADEILRASEEQYRLLFDRNPMPCGFLRVPPSNFARSTKRPSATTAIRETNFSR